MTTFAMDNNTADYLYLLTVYLAVSVTEPPGSAQLIAYCMILGHFLPSPEHLS
jgi:hypothetical protein